jgi:A/G-specific adenine glycosylase
MAGSLIDKRCPGIYNQAIMDFGATICRPRNPLCPKCIQATECEALRHNCVNILPVKEKTLKKRTRWFYYFIIEVGNSVYLRKRETKDIWQNLYEFVLMETDQPSDEKANNFLNGILRQPYTIKCTSKAYSQQLTHQQIHGKFFVVKLSAEAKLQGNYELVDKAWLNQYAFPKLINSYLQSTLKNR